jgi:formylmethanofuran dehydrogenase subunit E
MMRFLVCCLLLGAASYCIAQEPAVQLPRPKFKLDPADPSWLGPAVQFHGHLGPWLVAGLRIGAAGLRAVGADGYFDVDITVEGPLALPPQACFLDGLQVSTGATLGKRNLKWVEAPRLIVRVKNVRTGKVVVVRPTAEMVHWIASAKGAPLSPANPSLATSAAGHNHEAKDSDSLDVVARRIARATEHEVLIVSGR